MLGKTNIIYVAKDQNSEMQFVKEYIQTKSTSNIAKVEYYNGTLFALTGNGTGNGWHVLYGSDANKLEYLKYNDAMIEITDVQFFDGNYIFYNRKKEFESNTENGIITLEYYAGSNLLQLEKKCLTYNTNETKWLKYGSIIGAEINSENNLVFLIAAHDMVSSTTVNIWYVIDILSDLDTVQKEIVTEKNNIALGDNSQIWFMRDRFFGLNYRSSKTCFILSLDGIITQQNECAFPKMVLNDIAYYIVDSAIYYSTNFINKVLIRSGNSNRKTEKVFSIKERIAFYDKCNPESDSILSLADSFNDIKDKMASIVIGTFCDYDVYCWVEAGEYTYFGGPNGIIVKCLLDIEGSYQLPEITLVKTLAAREALDQAKQYTDEKIAELKSYVDSLNGSST